MLHKTKMLITGVILLLSLVPYTPIRAGGGQIFEETATEPCMTTVHFSHYRNVVSCATGVFIRNELVYVSQTYVYYTRSYCNGGWGWCMYSDNPCLAVDLMSATDQPTVCE